jgi:hypothetical protein
MKDPEFGTTVAPGFALKGGVRDNFSPKKVLWLISITVTLIGVMFGIGILASYSGKAHSFDTPSCPLVAAREGYI